MSSICFLHVLVSGYVASFIRATSFIMSILFACMIFFLIIVYSTGMYPVSLSRIIVGMPFGRYRRVFITSLNMVCSFLFSSLPIAPPSPLMAEYCCKRRPAIRSTAHKLPHVPTVNIGGWYSGQAKLTKSKYFM